MSYLQQNPGRLPDFSQAVISFWFRVPQVSLDAVWAAYVGQEGVPFDGIVPLVVMGDPGTGMIPQNAPAEELVKFEYSNITAVEGAEGQNFSYVQIGMCPQYGTSSKRMQGTRTVNLLAHFVPQPNTYSYQTYHNLEETGEPAPMTNPTCIGVDYSGSEPVLYVNFETNQTPSVVNYAFNTSLVLGPPIPVPPENMQNAFDQGTRITQWCTPPLGLDIENIGPIDEISNTIVTVRYPPVSIAEGIEHYEDVSELAVSKTGVIGNLGWLPAAADQWHHVLISLDLQTIETHGRADSSEPVVSEIAPYTDSAARLFIALDDVNYTEFDLSNYWVYGSDDPNAVITEEANDVAGSSPNEDEDGNSLGAAEYIIESPVIACNGKAIGLPGITDFVNNIYQVEMAEFQMWTDVTLDTGVEKNRRAFIDYKRDDKGKPIPDKDGNLTLRPVDPKEAEKLIGKRPLVLLHGTGKWIHGVNTGSLGLSDKGKKLPAGQFTPIGVIKPYKPDPSIPPPAAPAAARATAPEIVVRRRAKEAVT